MLSKINAQSNLYAEKTNMKPSFKGGFQLLGEKAKIAYDEFLPTMNILTKKGRIQIAPITDFTIPRFHVTCEKKLDIDAYTNLSKLAEKHNLSLEANNVDYYQEIPSFDLINTKQEFNSNWNNWKALGNVEDLKKIRRE